MSLGVLYGVLHDLAFSVYIGGLVYAEIVLPPAANAIAPAQGMVVRRKAGDLQMIAAWSALFLILITGILRLGHMGMLAFPGTFFLKGEVAETSFGQTIFTMFGLWCVLVAIGVVMTFVLRPRLAGKIDPTLSAAEREAKQRQMMSAARWLSILLRLDLAVAVTAAIMGASLAYGGLV